MTLGLTHLLQEMSTRNISWGWRWLVCRADNLTTYMCWLSSNLGALTFWNPQGLSRPVMGLLYLLLTVSLSVLFLYWCVIVTAKFSFCWLFLHQLFNWLRLQNWIEAFIVFVIEFDVQFYNLVHMVLYGGVYMSAFKNFCDDWNDFINGGEQMTLFVEVLSEFWSPCAYSKST
jgi:hypothetical protein